VLGSVLGLAPSAAAAQVLADAVAIPAENTAKWLTEHARNTDRLTRLGQLQDRLRRASPSRATNALREQANELAREVAAWELRRGQLVILDEASLASTRRADRGPPLHRAVGTGRLVAVARRPPRRHRRLPDA
jgi:hypothetical protein